jgi:murein endopeptidase
MIFLVSPAFLFILSAALQPPHAPAFFDDPVGSYAEAPDDEEEAEASSADADDGAGSADAESESAEPGNATSGFQYSADLSDAELQRRWKEDLASLGTISVGFADQGRLINAARMPPDEAWVCKRPELAFGAQETVEALMAAFRTVHKQFPTSAPARLNHIGGMEGGYLKPHRSHQSGRDADIGFFYKSDMAPAPGARREKLIDPVRNWALLRALATETDVQVILVDRGILKVLRAYAIKAGEDRDFVDGLFLGGHKALIQHARHHKDHFHVRFYAPRSQELGRRIQSFLALRPEQNLMMHKVKRGETLGYIAHATGSTVALIQKANHLRGTFLRLGQQLRVPLRGPCTRCPLPPAVVVPPRRLPALPVSAVAASG